MAGEQYTPGYSANATEFMRQRRAATHAAFLLPRLHTGMRLLDCGCGPGSITLDFARILGPGSVTGIDREATQIEVARQAAAAERIDAHFETAGIDALPFADGSFDVVHAHALFEHLANPLEALEQFRRVLKPGGMAALRAPDWGGFLLHPYTPAVEREFDRYQQIQRANGGDVRVGRKLPSYLRAAGFERVQTTASYEIYENTGRIGEYLAVQLETRGELEGARVWREWSCHPDALFAQAWVEAIGYREPDAQAERGSAMAETGGVTLSATSSRRDTCIATIAAR